MEHDQNNGHNPKMQVLVQPNIGLDSDVRQSIVDILNITLADEALLAQKTRSAHWNTSGADFLELHPLFETQYQLLNNISNDIAERTRMLGGLAVGSLQGFLNLSRLKEEPGNASMILVLLADHEACIRFLRDDARKCTEEYEDEGTFELLISTMRLHEKLAWMLRSVIEPELTQTAEILPSTTKKMSFKTSPDGHKVTKRYR